MPLSFEIISSPGDIDIRIRDFIEANDNDFYPTIASRRGLTDFVQSVYDAKGKYVICFEETTIVGLAGVYLDHPAFITYYLYVAVDKAHRGQGISTALFNYVHEICRENGVQRAIVKTWSTNKVSQSMFKKHGFFHLYTAENDRSKGVHTYFYVKSFSPQLLKKPVTSIAVMGNGDNYALGNFIKTISSIPRTLSLTDVPVPFVVISDKDDDSLIVLSHNTASHLLLLDAYKYKLPAVYEKPEDTEVIDVALITRRLVQQRNKRWMLISDNSIEALTYWGLDGISLPGEKQQQHVNKVINEVQKGDVTPAYYKNEIVAIALLNKCDGIVLAAPELHTMFGFDKAYNGVEVFDPLVELAILIQDSRTGLKLTR